MSRNAWIAVVAIIVVLAGAAVLVANVGPGEPSDNASSTVTVTPSPTVVAGAPTVATDSVVTPSASTAVVTGKVTPNGGSTSYWFEYGTTPSMENRTASQNIGSGFVAISTPGYITGLSSNTKYYFRLMAQNNYGTVPGTQYAFQTTLAQPPAGNAPTTQTLAASGVSRTTVNLNGRVNPNQAQTTYWFEYGQSANLGSVTAFQSAGSGNSAQNVSISVSGLEPQIKYYFRLNAQNQFGTVNGAIMNFTTLGPAAPGQPSVDTRSAAGVATSTAVLRASVNPNGAQATVWFEYSTDSLLGNILGSTSHQQSAGSGNSNVDVSAQVSGLSRNTRYYYRAVAQNQYGTVRGDVENFRTDSR